MVTLPARGVHQAGTAEQGVRPEVHRVEEVVIDPPVDDVHLLESLGGPHHHPAALADQVAALDQLDAHRPGQECVLEAGAVEEAGGEHHDGRVVDPGRGAGTQGVEQPARVGADRPDPVTGEGLGERGRDGPPVGQHVGGPRGHPDVVLEQPELPRLSRIRSMPATWIRTPFGLCTPAATRW
jgi:hypothetical protein